jgi:hypothetical protein
MPTRFANLDSTPMIMRAILGTTEMCATDKATRKKEEAKLRGVWKRVPGSSAHRVRFTDADAKREGCIDILLFLGAAFHYLRTKVTLCAVKCG